ncbi:AAA family ATPase [Sneathiella marina]|uniref:AAA family ATPase n=1 Tax=Sneathiella marina TaxID=2950108 RepID=A0ABY4W737_9PROT|nr:AAA family ATPase [Sneathiella marina]USG62656.1 AAA family ATPase [Sneathiella marina]
MQTSSEKPETSNRVVIISGCSGGGKSTLVQALCERGWNTVEEAGRQVVQSELAKNGNALPWRDPAAFVAQAATVSIRQIDQALTGSKKSLIISDRSIIDTISYLEFCHLETPEKMLNWLQIHRYNLTVFFVPPWESIFASDQERPKPFKQAIAEYEHLKRAYQSLGYQLLEIPQLPVKKRVDFVEHHLHRLAE